MPEPNAFWDDLSRDLQDPEAAAEFAANQARIRAHDQAVNDAYPSPADISAPPSGCRQCGTPERGHAGDHIYAAPDNALRLARMRSRRKARLEPHRRFRATPAMLANITVDMGFFSAALDRLDGVLRPLVGPLREVAQANARYQDDGDWGEPVTETDADWPADASSTCAHVCGGDADHACDAKACRRLEYTLPSGGTRSMPICQPCYNAEWAARQRYRVAA